MLLLLCQLMAEGVLASALDCNLGGRQALPGHVLAPSAALAGSLLSTLRAGLVSVSRPGLLCRLGTWWGCVVGVAVIWAKLGTLRFGPYDCG